MQGPFETWREGISGSLESFVHRAAPMLERVHWLGGDAAQRLLDFCTGGKMIRGGLVCVGHGLFRGEATADTFLAAAAVEIVQSALLIHDDIMDRDTTRRGRPSIFSQYTTVLRERNIPDSLHGGEALGMCAGDIAFFLAFEMLASLNAPADRRARIVTLTARELSYVGVAQMADVFRGTEASEFTSGPVAGSMEETLRIYRFKTGRYTFSLPLMIGGILAHGDEATLGILERLGEQLGILFQIKDDEIGLFGCEESTGKPIGSDVRTGKKTLYHHELAKRAGEADRSRLAAIFGNPGATEEDIDFVRGLLRSLGIKAGIEERMGGMAREVSAFIEELPDAPERRLLQELLIFNRDRTS